MSTQNSPVLRRHLSLGVVTIALITGAMTITAQAAETGSKKQEVTRSAIHVDANTARYKPVEPGISRAVIWGDPEKGPYGAFTKFQPGQNNPLHYHPNTIRLVVLKGAYVYQPEGGRAIRVGAGQFISIPAKVHHVSGGDPKEGALFYEEGTGPFGTHFLHERTQRTGRLENPKKY